MKRNMMFKHQLQDKYKIWHPIFCGYGYYNIDKPYAKIVLDTNPKMSKHKHIELLLNFYNKIQKKHDIEPIINVPMLAFKTHKYLLNNSNKEFEYIHILDNQVTTYLEHTGSRMDNLNYEIGKPNYEQIHPYIKNTNKHWNTRNGTITMTISIPVAKELTDYIIATTITSKNNYGKINSERKEILKKLTELLDF